MANPISLKWKNDGNWDKLMRGGRTTATTCLVLSTMVVGTEATVYLQHHDGSIEIGDAVQNGFRYYSVIATDPEFHWFILEVDSRFIPYQPNTPLILLKPNSFSDSDLCLETVLQQIGAYTYLVQYMFNNTVNVRDVNAIPPRFYYPTKHTSLTGFLELIGQTLRAYWDFPAVVTGLDGFPVFIPQLVQISGVKMWQWVDKKLGKVISVNSTDKAIKTIPVMQMPCKAILGANMFAIARKESTSQRFFLALDIVYPEDLHRGDRIRFYTTAASMDMWDLPTDPIQAKCLVYDITGARVRVIYQTGAFAAGDHLYESATPGLIYTVLKVEKQGSGYSLYLNIVPPMWPRNTELTKVEKDVRVPGKRTMPLIQKATGIFLSYEKRDSVRLIVKEGSLNWFSAQIARGTPIVGDVFHVLNETELYTITKIDQDNFYCDPAPRSSFTNSTELEIVRSVMDISCGISTPAYGEYYLSMTSTPMLYSNTTFKIMRCDPETYDLIYDEEQNWSPAVINANPFCTHYIYKKGDYCYNGTIFPRTMEHVTELLYEYQRLITAMWDQIQILASYIAGTSTMETWLGLAQGHLSVDPYWQLFYEELT